MLLSGISRRKTTNTHSVLYLITRNIVIIVRYVRDYSPEMPDKIILRVPADMSIDGSVNTCMKLSLERVTRRWSCVKFPHPPSSSVIRAATNGDVFASWRPISPTFFHERQTPWPPPGFYSGALKSLNLSAAPRANAFRFGTSSHDENLRPSSRSMIKRTFAAKVAVTRVIASNVRVMFEWSASSDEPLR